MNKTKIIVRFEDGHNMSFTSNSDVKLSTAKSREAIAGYEELYTRSKVEDVLVESIISPIVVIVIDECGDEIDNYECESWYEISNHFNEHNPYFPPENWSEIHVINNKNPKTQNDQNNISSS
jgi:hypothetical protein